MKQDDPSRNDQPSSASDKRTAAQWTLLCLSLAIVLGLVGYITYEHVVTGHTPPIIVLQPDMNSVRKAHDRYFLDVQVMNKGDQVAGKVFIRIRAEAMPNRQPEEADVRIDFLPGRDQETHTVSFSKRPRPEAITYTAAFLKP